MSKFKIGDQVRRIKDFEVLPEGIYTINDFDYENIKLESSNFSYNPSNFELVLATSEPTPYEMKRGYWTKPALTETTSVGKNTVSVSTFRTSEPEDKPAELSTGGVKYDDNKPQLDLISTRWIMGVGEVLSFGSKKYAPHNWRKGIKISRLIAACLRHVFAFLGGETLDPETGKSHLLHASACLMFAFELMETKPEMDDRYRESK